MDPHGSDLSHIFIKWMNNLGITINFRHMKFPSKRDLNISQIMHLFGKISTRKVNGSILVLCFQPFLQIPHGLAAISPAKLCLCSWRISKFYLLLLINLFAAIQYYFWIKGEITKVGYTFVTIGSPNFRKTHFRPN